MPLSRRAFMLGLGASVLMAGCSRETTTTAAPVDFLGSRRHAGDPLYSVESHAYLAAFEPHLVHAAQGVYGADLLATCQSGAVALYDRCPFDRITVGYCAASQSYACPACGSRYNRIGEVIDGPTTRGLDHLVVQVDASGELIISRSRRVDGPPTGVWLVKPAEGQPAPPGNCEGPLPDPTRQA